jgi:dsDNA-binding SOS-regulon protein
MAVETRYVVVRGGNEIMTFADKKAADEYDRMLDMADNMTALLENSDVVLDDKTREDLCVYMAKNREEVLVALLAKKKSAKVEAPVVKKVMVEKTAAEKKPAPRKKAAIKAA